MGSRLGGRGGSEESFADAEGGIPAGHGLGRSDESERNHALSRPDRAGEDGAIAQHDHILQVVILSTRTGRNQSSDSHFFSS